MYCNQCGIAMPDTAVQCARCGRVVPQVIVRRRLLRPLHHRRIAGVCAAFANYFEFDVTIVRLVWFLTFIFGGTGLIAYLIAWIVIPEQDQPALPVIVPMTTPAGNNIASQP